MTTGRFCAKIDGVDCNFCLKETPKGYLGSVTVPTPKGPIVVAIRFPVEAIKAFYAQHRHHIEEALGGAASAGTEIGRRRRRRFGSRLRKMFKGKVIRKLGGFAKKILNSKLVKGAMKIARFIPGYGQAINAGYNAATKAANIASNLGRSGRQGQAARRGVSALRQVAQGRGTASLRGMASRFLGRSGVDARTAQGSLRGIGRSFANRYGGALRRMAGQGAVSSGHDLAIIGGAMALWGDASQQQIVTGGAFYDELETLDGRGSVSGNALDEHTEVGRRRRRRRRRGILKKLFVPFAMFKKNKGRRGRSGTRTSGVPVEAGFSLYSKGYDDGDGWFRSAYYDGLQALAGQATQAAAA